MDNSNGITPVMPIGNSAADGSLTWIFALLILMGLFNGNGFGGGYGGNSNAIQNDVNRGFDNQNLQAQTRDILTAVTNGTAQSVSAANQVYHDLAGNISDKYAEITRDVGNLAMQVQSGIANQNACCCDTKMLIQGTAADINANTTAQTQRILDALAQNKIEALQAQVSELQLQNQMQGVVRYPNAWTYNAGMSPFCGGGCGCGNV